MAKSTNNNLIVSNIKKSESILTRSFLYSFFTISLFGIVLSIISYIILGNYIEKAVTEEAFQLTNLTKNLFNVEDIVDIKKSNYSKNSPSQINTTKQLDFICENNEHISQAYFMEIELQNDNSLVAISTNTSLSEKGLAPGESYASSDTWLKAYNEMMKSKEPAKTDIYSDDFGTWQTILTPITYQNQVIAFYGIDTDAKITQNAKKRWLYG